MVNPRNRNADKREIFQAVHKVISLKPKRSISVLFHSHITGRARTSESRNAMLKMPRIVMIAVEIFINITLTVFLEMSRILFEYRGGALEQNAGQQQQLERVKITDRLYAKHTHNCGVPTPFHNKSTDKKDDNNGENVTSKQGVSFFSFNVHSRYDVVSFCRKVKNFFTNQT
jgi:hypothetical protein